MKNILATLALAATLPAAASAAPLPISVGDLVSGGIDNLMPGGSETFGFKATERMRISSVSYTLNGYSRADLRNVSFGVNVLNDGLIDSDITAGGGVAEGGKISTVNLYLSTDDIFSILLSDGITQPVDFDFKFVPQTVPVPAAGLLLGSVLLGGGALARRKKNA